MMWDGCVCVKKILLFFLCMYRITFRPRRAPQR